MISILFAAALFPGMVPTASATPPIEDPCDFEAVAPTFDDQRQKDVELADLATLADVGRANAGTAPSTLSISPDGDRVAFLVAKANPGANAYCRQLLVLTFASKDPPREIDRGGEFMHDDFPLRDFASVTAGWERATEPRWSPDGKRIAYLKREARSTQVWVADPSGVVEATRLTDLPDDVTGLAWTPDGQGLVVATRPGLRREAEAIAAEGLQGFLFDARFSPNFADRPIPKDAGQPAYSWVSASDSRSRPATDAEIRLLRPGPPGAPSAAVLLYREGPREQAAWVEAEDPEQLLSPTRVVIRGPDGVRLVCPPDRCGDIQGLWWSERAHALFIQRATGWARSETTLMRWDMGASTPRSVLATRDAVRGCSEHLGELLCARESATMPRRIVAINMETGADRLVFDPNPKFANLRFGSIERFQFRNAAGVESFADLILPPDHRQGDRHPMVIVQYRSRGFLRGGTGDEVPIFALAARGFAVLSFDRPDFLPAAYRATTDVELATLAGDQWADRRQVQSSLEIAIDEAIATGAVDPDRIGITGFSEGGAAAQFAIVNSRIFRAAALGSCCEDIYAYALAAGPRFTRYLRDVGYDPLALRDPHSWSPMSLILNRSSVRTPILIQAADSEYQGALDVFEVYTNEHKPIEMVVFPDETHIKWQPAHRLAMYERVVDWFEFWLAGRMNCAPSRAGQYRRWQSMTGAPEPEALRCYSADLSDP